MKKWHFTESQSAELAKSAKTHSTAYVRQKALALHHMACGKTAEEAAEIVLAHRASVADWAHRYFEFGLDGLQVASGRGRRAQADAEELERYVRQSPMAFGVNKSRWTLVLLSQIVPCLKGMSDAGVLRALRRLGYAYKRGQPHLHSPDPDYEAKKGQWTKR